MTSKLITCPICDGDWLFRMPDGKASICSGCGGDGKVTEQRAKEITAEICEKLLELTQM